jgi:hypothetical protein
MNSVLALAAVLAPLAADPVAPQQPEVSIRVRPTSITFLNPTTEPRLLVFEPTAGAPRATRWLAPRGSYKAQFAQGTLDGMRLEVLYPAERGWRSSEALGLGDLAPAGDGLIDLLDLGARSRFLSHTPRGPRFLETSGSLVPDLPGALGGTMNSTATGSGGCGHVPVVPPRERRAGGGPPKVGGKPLPPV